jgi:hypothetical protein
MRWVSLLAVALMGIAGLSVAVALPATAVSVLAVTSVTPASGPTAGGTSVDIEGTKFSKGGLAVHFGTVPATGVKYISKSVVTATAPAQAAGAVDVTVSTNAGGTSATSAADLFTYQAAAVAPTVTSVSPASGPAAGGTQVSVSGTSFTGATAVSFGSTPATAVTVNSATSITATSPAGTGTVDVSVTTPAGTSALSAADQFDYTTGPPPSSLTIANGNAAYTPGSALPANTPITPNQFNVLTLVDGGAAAVNPASLTIVTPPSSGSATASTSNGIITYTPGASTTGPQSLTFAYCAPTFTYSSNSAKCTTATLTYTPTTNQPMGDLVFGVEGVVQDIAQAVTLPATALPNSTVTMTDAPAATALPSTQSGVTITSVGQFSGIFPVPAGFTYVPGSLAVTGGDAVSSGNYTAAYCTAPLANACTANLGGGNYKTTTPYIETFLNPNVHPAGGSNLTLPTVSAQFTVSGSVGTAISVSMSEYVSAITVAGIGAITFDGYPSCDSCNPPPSTTAPVYANPVRLATTVIGAPGTVATLPFTDDNGYVLSGSDGGIFTFGDAGYFGSMGNKHLNAPIVGIASTPDQDGYWLVASDGGIFTFGDAGYFGSMGNKHLNAPIVGIASTPDGNGYWLVASDGGIFTFGDAGYFGSMGNKHLNAPIVGIASTATGDGYWLVAKDGGIFTFGDASYLGSMGSKHLNAPIVGIASTNDGSGYWMVASDGGIFTFGDAGYFGSMGNKHLNAPIVGITSTSTGDGYRMVASDGGIFTFGDAGYFGSMGSKHLNAPIVGIGR